MASMTEKENRKNVVLKFYDKVNAAISEAKYFIYVGRVQRPLKTPKGSPCAYLIQDWEVCKRRAIYKLNGHFFF